MISLGGVGALGVAFAVCALIAKKKEDFSNIIQNEQDLLDVMKGQVIEKQIVEETVEENEEEAPAEEPVEETAVEEPVEE